MDLQVFVRGFVVGLALAAPVGPIAILVVTRSVRDGALAGLAAGLGVATADAIFATIGALGLATLGSPSVTFRVVAGLFLVGLGARTFLSRSPPRSATGARIPYVRAFATTLVYTLANPISILTFAAVAGSLRRAPESALGNGAYAFSLASGVFTGSLGWWILLATGAGLLRARVTDRLFAASNRIAGVALVLFGLVALVDRH